MSAQADGLKLVSSNFAKKKRPDDRMRMDFSDDRISDYLYSVEKVIAARVRGTVCCWMERLIQRVLEGH